MSFDWKKLVRTVAPALGSALGTPMIGSAVSVIANAVLGKEGTEEEVAAELAKGLSPEALVALKEADRQFTVRMRELDIDVQRLAKESDDAYLADTQNARAAHKGERSVVYIGSAILAIFFITVVAIVVGLFSLMGRGIDVKDAGLVAAVFGLLGSIVGYVAANAQQVVNFFFGSSKGSKEKTDGLVNAIASVGRIR